MKNKTRYLPALFALNRNSAQLHSGEIADLGKMDFYRFWQSDAAPQLAGASSALFSANSNNIGHFLKNCPVISKSCLVINKLMLQSADAICSLFPLGVVDRPAPGGILLWDAGLPGMNLKAILKGTQELYTVVYMPGLQVSADILEHLFSRNLTNGFLLISKNLHQEMVGHSSDIPALFAADYLMIHGASDTDTISAHLPRTKVSQPEHNLVVNFHNPSMPIHSGKRMPLVNRGNDCTKPHKLSLSVSQGFSLVEKPLLDGSELRRKRKECITVILDQPDNAYYTVMLTENDSTFSQRLHAFFDRGILSR